MRDSEAWRAAVHRVLKSWCHWVTEQQLLGLSRSVWTREPPPEGLGRPPVAIGSIACSHSGPEFFFLEGILVVQSSSVTQSCPTLCGPMDCSTPGLPVHHQLPELTRSHVHQVGDAIQPSHPLSSPSPPAFNLSQHQGLLVEEVAFFFLKRYMRNN